MNNLNDEVANAFGRAYNAWTFWTFGELMWWTVAENLATLTVNEKLVWGPPHLVPLDQ